MRQSSPAGQCWQTTRPPSGRPVPAPMAETIRLQGLDGVWEALGVVRDPHVPPESITASANEWGPTSSPAARPDPLRAREHARGGAGSDCRPARPRSTPRRVQEHARRADRQARARRARQRGAMRRRVDDASSVALTPGRWPRSSSASSPLTGAGRPSAGAREAGELSSVRAPVACCASSQRDGTRKRALRKAPGHGVHRVTPLRGRGRRSKGGGDRLEGLSALHPASSRLGAPASFSICVPTLNA
jgi:hypothetical protein